MTLACIPNRLGVAAPTVAGEEEGDVLTDSVTQLMTEVIVEQAPGYARAC